MLLDDQGLMAWVSESGEVIADVATESGPDAAIAGCGDWTMTDLLGHVAPMYSGWYLYNLTHSPGEGDVAAAMSSAPEMPSTHDARIHYLRDACERFDAEARSVDLDADVWAFWMTRPARYWLLRAATEFAVHAWDAQTVLGSATPIGADRSATAIDETLRGMWPGLVELGRRGIILEQPPALPDEPAGMIATDSGHAWEISQMNGEIEVTAVSNPPATSVSGRGHDLVMYQWGRKPTTEPDVAGDQAIADAWNLYCATSVAQQQARRREN